MIIFHNDGILAGSLLNVNRCVRWLSRRWSDVPIRISAVTKPTGAIHRHAGFDTPFVSFQEHPQSGRATQPAERQNFQVV